MSHHHAPAVLPISWADYHALCKGLALALATYNPGLILGITKGGLYPGTLLAHLLQREFYPIRLTRRVNDIKVRQHPEWLLRPPEAVAGQDVLIVDEICASGETLGMARAETLARGARSVRGAVLYAHGSGIAFADYIGLVSDALILNPWDREVLRQGEFVFNPEYVEAMQEMALPLATEYWPGVGVARLAKQPEA